MKHNTNEIQATTPPSPAAVAPIINPEDEMRELVSDLLMLMIGDSSERDIVNGIMLFLYNISRQKPLTAIDCLQWAVTHCFRWSVESSYAQNAHIAGLLATRAARKAEVAGGEEMKGGAQ